MGVVTRGRGRSLYRAYWDVLDSPVLSLLIELQAAGVEFRMCSGAVQFRRHGGSSLTDIERQQLAEYADAVPTLIIMLADDGLRARRRQFELMFAEALPGTLPTNVVRRGIPYAIGVCFSCGAALPKPQFGRCWRCALAWRIAWRYPLPASVVSAADEARIA
jgi:hypothetical protein